MAEAATSSQIRDSTAELALIGFIALLPIIVRTSSL
jgi:hypothetical protein